jgi:hypothetical protein
MPIAANAAEAVAQSKSQNMPLVIAILSESGASSERELLESCDFSDVVFLCTPCGSVDASNFGKMFPLPVTPIVYFILPSGKPVSVLKSSFSCSDIQEGITKALAELNCSSPTPHPTSSPAENAGNAASSDASVADATSLAQRKESARKPDLLCFCQLLPVVFGLDYSAGRIARKISDRQGPRGRGEKSC